MDKQKILESILALVLLLGLMSWWFKQPLYLEIALGLGFLSLLSPLFAWLLAQLWSKILHLLGKIQSFLVLFIFYFLILSPLALLKRLLTKDTLDIKQPRKSSFFRARNYSYSPEDFKKMW